MEIINFSKEIMLAAQENTKGRTFNYEIDIFSLVGGAISLMLTYQFFGNPIYHASGLISFIIDRIPDHYSSFKLFELTEDPRFKKYGIDKYNEETNRLLPKYPKTKDLSSKKQIAIQTLFGILSTVIPSAGHGCVSGTPLLYENNRTCYKAIKKAFEIGDEVKEKIEEGLSEEQIKEYLENLYKK